MQYFLYKNISKKIHIHIYITYYKLHILYRICFDFTFLFMITLMLIIFMRILHIYFNLLDILHIFVRKIICKNTLYCFSDGLGSNLNDLIKKLI